MPIEQLLLAKPIKASDIYSFALSILYLSFPEAQSNFPDDPFELAVIESAEQVCETLSIDLQSLDDKWIKFFKASLTCKPDQRASVEDLMKIMSIPIDNVFDLNYYVDNVSRFVNWSL